MKVILIGSIIILLICIVFSKEEKPSILSNNHLPDGNNNTYSGFNVTANSNIGIGNKVYDVNGEIVESNGIKIRVIGSKEMILVSDLKTKQEGL